MLWVLSLIRAAIAVRACHVALRASIYVALFALPVIAAAQDDASATAFELDWEAPRGCMSSTQARSAIEQLLSPNASTGDEPAQVEVQIEATEEGRFEAEITVQHDESEGERTLRGESCPQLAEAAVLIVAMVLDPVGASLRVVAPAQLEPSSPEPQDESPNERVRVALGLRLAADVGALPTSTGGAGLTLGLHFATLGTVLRVQLEALAWMPQDALGGPVAASGATIGLYTSALRGCLDLVSAAQRELAFGTCLTAEAGLSTGRALGISDGRAQQGLWSAGLLGLFARKALPGPLQLELLAEVGAPLHRPSYGIDGFGLIFRASSFIARFGLGVGWLFP